MYAKLRTVRDFWKICGENTGGTRTCVQGSSVARLERVGRPPCYMRRIWAHEISFFIPRGGDVAHLGSGPAQSLLRICSGRLTFAKAKYHFRHAAPQHAELL